MAVRLTGRHVAGRIAVLGLLVTLGCAAQTGDHGSRPRPTTAAPSATHAAGGSAAPKALKVTYDGPGANRGNRRIHLVLLVSGTHHARLDSEIATYPPMSSVWDGRRLLVHEPEEYRPWILYEAPEEHPDALDQVTGWRLDPTSAAFARDCPSAARIGRRTILGRTAVGYRCGAVHTSQLDRGARNLWLDEETGLLLVDPPLSATAIDESPTVTGSTFSTRPPAGSEVTVYGPRKAKEDGQHGRAPGFSLERLHGGTARLADYAGRPVVLAFFASDLVYDPAGEECHRCIPSLLDLQRETSGGTHPAVLAVQGGDRGKPGHLLVPDGVRLPVANDPGFDVQHAYGLEGRVAFAFVGADGTVHQVIDGPATGQQLRTALDGLR